MQIQHYHYTLSKTNRELRNFASSVKNKLYSDHIYNQFIKFEEEKNKKLCKKVKVKQIKRLESLSQTKTTKTHNIFIIKQV